jgi:hypothetical protein
LGYEMDCQKKDLTFGDHQQELYIAKYDSYM